MRVTQRLAFPCSVSSVASDPAGGQVAVAVGMSPRRLDRPASQREDPHIHLYGVIGGRLEHERAVTLEGLGASSHWEDAKVAFLDSQTLLLAARRLDARARTKEDIVLIALDVATGRERGRWTWASFLERIPCDLVPVPPHHALVSVSNNVICVDVARFEEVCRARDVDEEDVIEEDASPEERLAPNGLAFDASASRAYLLCQAFGQAILLQARLDLASGTFVREGRWVFAERNDSVGLCLTPGGGLTLLFQTADGLADLEGRPIGWGEETRQELLARPRAQVPARPKTARLGFAVLCPDGPGGPPRRIPFDSDFDRDFSTEPFTTEDENGPRVQVGYRYTAGDVSRMLAHGDFLTRPLYVNPRHVVLGTPSGLLLRLDTDSEQSETLFDGRSRINALDYHAASNRLIAGCESGNVIVFSV